MLFAILFGLSMDYQGPWSAACTRRGAQPRQPARSRSSAGLRRHHHGGRDRGGRRSCSATTALSLIGLGSRQRDLIDASHPANRVLVPSVMRTARRWNWYLPLAFSHNTASLGRAARRSAAARAGAGRTRRATGQGLESALFGSGDGGQRSRHSQLGVVGDRSLDHGQGHGP